MNPTDFYLSQISLYHETLKKVKRQRNFITFLKLAAFAEIIYFLILFLDRQPVYNLYCSIGGIVLFIILNIIDSKIVLRKKRIETFIKHCLTEMAYLKGDLSGLCNGQQYENPAHNYSTDLDIFGENSLFQHINRTVTDHGSNILSEWLLNPCLHKDKIIERQQTVTELASRIKWCMDFRTTGSVFRTDHANQEQLKKWQEEPAFFRFKGIRTLITIINATGVILWILTIISLIDYHIPLFFSILQLGATVFYSRKINASHRKLEKLIKALGNYVHSVTLIDRLDADTDGIKRIKSVLLNGETSSLTAFASLNKILNDFDQRNNILAAIVMNALYMKDLHSVIKLDKWKNRYAPGITAWIKAIGETDALVSMACYRYNHPRYVFPKISETALLRGEGIGHPLLPEDKTVTNDFQVENLHNLYIVTGANMAGKSTFLRTIGVNLVLALSGNAVCAETFEFQPMNLFSSMRTTDNLAKGTSYFHAELLRLQQLIKIASQSEKLFIILDEMLKGTNSRDKLNGSSKFLVKLLSFPVSGIIATHDLALGELAERYPSNFFNACFEISHTQDDITYDYKLKEGVIKNMNASILLRKMGLIDSE